MKKAFLLIAGLVLLAASVQAQKTNGRTFDNFDRSQGVLVYMPPEPVLPVAATSRKGKRGRQYQVVVDDKLVKKTVMSGPTAAVTDGLAQRSAASTFGGTPKLAMGSNATLKGFTTGNALHDLYIVESSRRYNIDPLLIYAQMHQESSFKIRAQSHKGASGLMQLMPATARRFGVTSIWDPKQNVDAGVKYMRWLMDTFNGNVVLALAGYNAGEGAVMKYGWNIPPYRETQEYVRRITSRYNSISDGRYIHSARAIDARSAGLVQKESQPLTIYEPVALTVRTADGKMMLMNQ